MENISHSFCDIMFAGDRRMADRIRPEDFRSLAILDSGRNWKLVATAATGNNSTARPKERTIYLKHRICAGIICAIVVNLGPYVLIFGAIGFGFRG
jgi:hypothetical protein